tara:strand:+ start:55 stop:504 length:450 start_codon:yes stop_codon:yes gene_type:complete
MAYKGRWKPKNIEKYAGDHNKIVFRSLWERQAFKWCDENPNIKSWHSEETVIPYRSSVDGRIHRYYMDLCINWNDGRTTLVEIKPEKQTKAPKKPKRQTRRYLNEVKTFATNISKWDAAKQFAENRGWGFEIWTEKHLASLGIKLYKRK